MAIHVKKHHILYTRSVHEANPYTKKLRETPGHIPPLVDDVEGDLHKAIAMVPPLDQYTAQHTLRILQPHRTYLGSINNLLYAIEEAANHSRATELQRDMAELTMRAISMQVPYIREGLITNEVGHGQASMGRR